jgi:peptide/nickel transport system permease protein
MTAYIIRRLLFGIILVFLASIIAFTLMRLTPGQVAQSAFEDPRVSKEYIEQQRRAFGLDRHPVVQYLDWLKGLFRGEMGLSFSYKQPVTTIIKSRIGPTLVLNLVTLFFTWAVAIPLGTWAAVNQYKLPDKLVSVFSFIGMSMPGFFMALVLLWLFASRLHWIPTGGLRSIDHDQLSFGGRILDYAHHLVVPVIVLTFGALASLQRVTRGNMLEVLRLQYVTTARAKGLSEHRVIYRHALRNAINPLVTLLGFEFAALFGGAALLENVINFPGMGQLLLEALRSKDQFLVMSILLIGSVLLVLGNLIGEILLAFVDPRVRYY